MILIKFYLGLKKKNVVFPLSLLTLIFCADPKVLLPFSDRLLKSDLFFYINAIKKYDKINKIPYLPTLFFSAMKAETQH